MQENDPSDLYYTSSPDKEELIKAKRDWTLVDDLLIRTGTLQISQSKWEAHLKEAVDEIRRAGQ